MNSQNIFDLFGRQKKDPINEYEKKLKLLVVGMINLTDKFDNFEEYVDSFKQELILHDKKLHSQSKQLVEHLINQGKYIENIESEFRMLFKSINIEIIRLNTFKTNTEKTLKDVLSKQIPPTDINPSE